ncbi:hypothetical protein BDV29DRAFT_177301 [Aspergillus leporis]|uniref:Uncharacterized protein n=1 Tax=Aspergillus leporis TaxID=41062 RepID=A0A5N5WXL9_9EURO|nr:hypothetical protein BDV29DRAFT_177301 [Aspergillus leporis]
MLRDGGKYHPKLYKNHIEDDYIRACLIRPAAAWNEGPGGVGYPQRWAQIRTTVGELVPTLREASLWSGIPYNALNNDGPRLVAEDGTERKNLFKYDPFHIFESGPKGPLAMLWVETSLHRTMRTTGELAARPCSLCISRFEAKLQLRLDRLSCMLYSRATALVDS